VTAVPGPLGRGTAALPVGRDDPLDLVVEGEEAHAREREAVVGPQLAAGDEDGDLLLKASSFGTVSASRSLSTELRSWPEKARLVRALRILGRVPAVRRKLALNLSGLAIDRRHGLAMATSAALRPASPRATSMRRRP
jgi:hypothetical protein